MRFLPVVLDSGDDRTVTTTAGPPLVWHREQRVAPMLLPIGYNGIGSSGRLLGEPAAPLPAPITAPVGAPGTPPVGACEDC